MIQWCSEIWNDRNDTVVLNKVKYNGFVKYGKKQYCSEIWYGTTLCSSHIIAISTNKTERRVSIYEESTSVSLRTAVL